MLTKQNKRGTKFWVLADSETGYILSFDIYMEKSTEKSSDDPRQEREPTTHVTVKLMISPANQAIRLMSELNPLPFKPSPTLVMSSFCKVALYLTAT